MFMLCRSGGYPGKFQRTIEVVAVAVTVHLEESARRFS
jgi:hypothetical protein